MAELCHFALLDANRPPICVNPLAKNYILLLISIKLIPYLKEGILRTNNKTLVIDKYIWEISVKITLVKTSILLINHNGQLRDILIQNCQISVSILRVISGTLVKDFSLYLMLTFKIYVKKFIWNKYLELVNLCRIHWRYFSMGKLSHILF